MKQMSLGEERVPQSCWLSWGCSAYQLIKCSLQTCEIAVPASDDDIMKEIQAEKMMKEAFSD